MTDAAEAFDDEYYEVRGMWCRMLVLCWGWVGAAVDSSAGGYVTCLMLG
jgi:hypothetical protein